MDRKGSTPVFARRQFVESTAPSLGVDKAAKLFDEVVQELGLRRAESYTMAEGQQILEQLKLRGGLVKILAISMITRLLVKDIS